VAAYRIYFYTAGDIHGREDFVAEDDVAALRIGSVLYNAASDVSQSFDLWQGARRITAAPASHPRLRLADLAEAHQCAVIETEERIQRSKWLIASSRRLIESLALARPGPPLPSRQRL
jgi:hypothetical protein